MFGISTQALSGQLLIGLINGSFYALLSLGLAIIFGLLHIINFAHGAIYMLGALLAWLLMAYLGIGYWWALIVVPVVVGGLGILLDRALMARLRGADPIYGLLLTFGLALMLQSAAHSAFGSSGLAYAVPRELRGGWNLGFVFLPTYRAWIILVSVLVCFGVWFAIERTRLGASLRAANEDPALVATFGIDVSRLITLAFAAGAALAGFAGVLAGPVYSVNPQMGVDIISIVFAVVVIGGMGSILGAIASGFGLGLLEALTKVAYPEASSVAIFVIMVLVIMVRPAGLFGKA